MKAKCVLCEVKADFFFNCLDEQPSCGGVKQAQFRGLNTAFIAKQLQLFAVLIEFGVEV